MNRPRRAQSMLVSPVLVGAMTVLVTIVAVVLAFQANNGLPFVPRYRLEVRLRDAAELTRGSEVHMGGALIGMVTAVNPAWDGGGRAVAVATVDLDRSVEPLATNSRFVVRQKDAIGEKYLAVTPGSARRTWPDGATVPISQTGATTDLDQVLSMFTPPTRRGVAATTTGFGEALAGRGATVNDAIGAFVPLVNDLGPVMRNVSSRRTGLGGFLRGLGTFTGALAPVAGRQANLYVNLDATFRALATVARPYLQDWIAQTPPAFRTVIADSPREQAFATDTAGLFAALRPGIASLPQSAPVLAGAFATGARTLPRSAALDRGVEHLSKTLAGYSATPAVQNGLRRVTQTAHSLIAPLSFLTPAQTSCNYVSLFLRNISSALSDPVGTGTVLRVVIVAIDDVAGGEAVPSQRAYLSSSAAGGHNHGPLHVDPYPNTDAPGQVAECSAGNEPYSASRAAIGNPSGDVGLHTQATGSAK